MIINFPHLLDGFFDVTSESVEFTAEANDSTTSAKTITKSGYSALGVVGFYHTHETEVNIDFLRITAAGALTVGVYNHTASDLTTKVTVRILWVKSS